MQNNDLELLRSRFEMKRLVSTDGYEWTFRDTGGNGPVLILLPGSLGSADIYFKQILELSESFRCVAINYPAAACERLAIGLAKFVKMQSIDYAHLVGASLAGYWLQYFIARYPELTRSATLVVPFLNGEKLRSHALFSIETLNAMSGDQVLSQWTQMLKAQPPNELRDIQLQLISQKVQTGELLRHRLLAAARATTPPLPAVDPQSVLIIDSEDDPILNEDIRDEVAARFLASRRHTFLTGGHYPHVTQSRQFNGVLRDFLAGFR